MISPPVHSTLRVRVYDHALKEYLSLVDHDDVNPASHMGVSIVFRHGDSGVLSDAIPVMVGLASVHDVVGSELLVNTCTVVLSDLTEHQGRDLAGLLLHHNLAIHDVRHLVRFMDVTGLDIPVEHVTCIRLASMLCDLGKYYRRYHTDVVPSNCDEEIELSRDHSREEAASLQVLATRYGIALDVPPAVEACGTWCDHAIVRGDDDWYPAVANVGARAAATAILAPFLMQDLSSDGLTGTFQGVQVPAAMSLARIELDGVTVDLELVMRAVDGCDRVVAVLEPLLHKAGLVRPLKDDQVVPRLRSMGVLKGSVLKTSKGWDRLSLRDLGMMADQDPILEMLWRYRVAYYAGTGVLRKCLQTDVAGRVHPVVDPLGTDTGRPSFSSPNLAGLARPFRPIVIPDGPGFGILEFDYEQQEAGIVGALFQDERLVCEFNAGDIYMAIARELVAPTLGLDVKGLDDAVLREKHPSLRSKCKVLTLATIYGLSPHGVADRMGLSDTAAKRLLDAFFDRYPGIRRGMMTQQILLARQGFVTSITGVRRHRPVHSSMDGWEQRWAVNAPIQASGADILKTVLPRAMAYLDGIGGRVLLPVYDSLVVQLPVPFRKKHINAVKAIMVDAFRELFPCLQPRVSVNSSQPRCWNDGGNADSAEAFVKRAVGDAE